MIFISYNHKDQQLVDMVARQLELSFGRNSIFYDRWSMQPGDSIIGKMNEGLEQYTTFFYFLSTNSLKSPMVTREWQSALMSSVNSDLKFVPIRLDDCPPLVIMKDLLYIDLYGIGIDEAIFQMKAVVNQENNYKPLEDKDNLICYLHVKSEYEIEFEIMATMFTVHDVNFGFIHTNEIENFDVISSTDSILCFSTGEFSGTLPSGEVKKYNITCRRLNRSLSPKSSFKGIIKTQVHTPELINIVHILSDKELNPIACYSQIMV
uniref:TIR domain-containing protein n=1 Tax=Streptococcus thermophilus TaxID=1308 RepID=Q70CB7_STRTR|nr:hypothetical protein [Streptococcus thermophilus]